MARKRKKKTPLNYTSKLIKRLLKKHNYVRLEVYSRNHYGSRSFGKPYGMRHLYANGNCRIRYYDDYDGKGFVGRRRSDSCFMEDVSTFTNGMGDYIEAKDLNRTVRAMQEHDRGSYKIKKIYAGDWVYELP